MQSHDNKIKIGFPTVPTRYRLFHYRKKKKFSLNMLLMYDFRYMSDSDKDVALFHLFTFISGFPSLLLESTMMIQRVLPVAAAMLATAAGIAEER